MKKQISLFALTLIGAIVLTACGNGAPTTAQTSESETTKEWKEVITLTGSGEKKSTSFELTGGKARARYNFNSGGFGTFALYVVKDGHDLMKEGGIPEVMLTETEEGESNLSHLKRGSYYLNVMAANGKWTVVIEQLQ